MQLKSKRLQRMQLFHRNALSGVDLQRSVLDMHVTLVQTYCSMVRMQKMVQTFAQEGFYSRGECQHSFLEKITSALFLKLHRRGCCVGAMNVTSSGLLR